MKVTEDPEQMLDPTLLLILTEFAIAGFTVIITVLLETVALVTQLTEEVN